MARKQEAERNAAIDRLRSYFLANIGTVLDTRTLREIAGVNEHGRRIRELRQREGFQILTHRDRTDLKPGQYLLLTAERLPVTARGMSAQVRLMVLERDGYTCQLCGGTQGDPDPTRPTRKLSLHVDHIVPESQGGSNEPENLRVLCSACNEARSNLVTPSEPAKSMLERVRRMPANVQREVYEWLHRKFGNQAERSKW